MTDNIPGQEIEAEVIYGWSSQKRLWYEKMAKYEALVDVDKAATEAIKDYFKTQCLHTHLSWQKCQYRGGKYAKLNNIAIWKVDMENYFLVNLKTGVWILLELNLS